MGYYSIPLLPIAKINIIDTICKMWIAKVLMYRCLGYILPVWKSLCDYHSKINANPMAQ